MLNMGGVGVAMGGKIDGEDEDCTPATMTVALAHHDDFCVHSLLATTEFLCNISYTLLYSMTTKIFSTTNEK